MDKNNMGKIFEALEKAEKKEPGKQQKYAADYEKQKNLKEIDEPINRKPVAHSKTKRVIIDPISNTEKLERSKSVRAADKAKIKKENAITLPLANKHFVGSADSLPIDNPKVEKFTEENRSILDEDTSSAKLSANSNNLSNEEICDPNNLGSISNLSDDIGRQDKLRPSIEKVGAFKGNIYDDGVRKSAIRYSKTKVQINDPEKLKKNRVLSIFDDVDTANQFKILRTQVLRKLKEIGGNSILVTSANPYEGKTFTSINLGLSIAKEFDRTVLIIDADIRRPTKKHTDFSTEFFSLKVEKGLTDYLMGDAEIEDVLINPGIDKITLIPGGVPVDNSPELLNSARMEMMMEEIKSRYPSDRLVIVDGPALLHFPDAMILYRYVDGVLPVVEAERTSTDQVKKVMKMLQDVNLLGVVMNKNKG